jgi:hypothetical protein
VSDDFEIFKEKSNREFDEMEEKPPMGCLTEFVLAVALLVGIGYCNHSRHLGHQQSSKPPVAKHQDHRPF